MRHKNRVGILCLLYALASLSCAKENQDDENAELKPDRSIPSNDQTPDEPSYQPSSYSTNSEDENVIGEVVNDEVESELTPLESEITENSSFNRVLPFEVNITGSSIDYGSSYAGSESFKITVKNTKNFAKYCLAPYDDVTGLYMTTNCQNTDQSLRLENFTNLAQYAPFDDQQVEGIGGDWLYDGSKDLWFFERKDDDIDWLDGGGVQLFIYSPNHQEIKVLNLLHTAGDGT